MPVGANGKYIKDNVELLRYNRMRQNREILYKLINHFR